MISTFLCFLKGSVRTSVFADLIEDHDLGFEPEKLRTDQFGRAGGVKFSAKNVDRLRSAKDWGSAAVEGPDGSIRLAGSGQIGQLIIWDTQTRPPVGLIEAVVGMPGFSAALVGDKEDGFWQSADQINTYEVSHRAWEHLPTVWDDVFERDKIDVSNNPGRRVPTPLMWLWAASEMWFGPGAFRILDRDRLVEAPALEVGVRADGVVFVKLFDLDDDIASIRSAQEKFRDWMGYDGIEATIDELAAEMADPQMEFDVGVFEHGGVRLVTEWLDSDGPVARSVATQKRCTELGEAGDIVWQETVPLI